MFTKSSKGYKTETLKSDAEYHTETTKAHNMSTYFRCYLCYYGQTNMNETGFNVPMYLISLKYNATNKNSLYLYNF